MHGEGSNPNSFRLLDENSNQAALFINESGDIIIAWIPVKNAAIYGPTSYKYDVALVNYETHSSVTNKSVGVYADLEQGSNKISVEALDSADMYTVCKHLILDLLSKILHLIS